MTTNEAEEPGAAPDIVGPGDGAWFPVVGVGASAGGLEAFTQLLEALPADTGMAFVLVQHLAPSHPSALAEILSRATTLPVTEVQGDSLVEPNHVYVIPPDRGMVIVHGALQLVPRAGPDSYRPVDRFFRALAEDRRHKAIGVVLSGTASDGTLGLEAIKAGGGITFAQDTTAQQDGMPQAAIASGCVDFVLPPNEIARELSRIGRHPYAVTPAAGCIADDEPHLAEVVQLLQHGTGVDFTHYKWNTLYRRVIRRMVFRKLVGLPEYVQYLRQTPDEVTALYQDILISVTSFFRDPGSFEVLAQTVLPQLLANRDARHPVRIWALGCSTGQEAYSLAIAFTEVAEAAGSDAKLQLFATDLNTVSIDTAREGVYPAAITQDVSPERLQRFFTAKDGSYRINKAIREACVFSRHDVLTDPPFSRIDLISCRNLLIYMEPVLQARVMRTLYYALNPGGHLWLGASESVGAQGNLFEVNDGKHKIFAKRSGSAPEPGRLPKHHGGAARAPFVPVTARVRDALDLPREADRILSNRFAPPGVLVSADLDILQYRGDTSPYLAPVPGRASLSLLKMLRGGLLVAVHSAILRAGKAQAPVHEEGLRVESNGGHHEAAVEVIPLRGPGGAMDGGFLVLFEATGPDTGERVPRPPEAAATDLDSARLGQELAATRAYLQSVIEQQDIANEELQAAHEEVQSANEELQSTNEELETSKEEIQSANEELATVNDELNQRNAELHRINDDLVNLFDAGELVVIMLGMDLRIRRFTPRAEHMFRLIPADVGRRLSDVSLALDGIPELEPLLEQVLDTVVPQECEARDKLGRWYSLRLRQYRTHEGTLDGVIVMLVDIDVQKRAHAYTESIIATIREPLLVLDSDLRVRTASHAFCETFRVARESVVGALLYELGERQWDQPELRERIAEVLARGRPFRDIEVVTDFAQIGRRTMLLNGRRLAQPDDVPPSILLVIEDITDRRREERRTRQRERFLQFIMDSAHIGDWDLDLTDDVTRRSLRHDQCFGYTQPIAKWGRATFLRHVHPDDRADVARQFEAAVANGHAFQLDCRVIWPDGSVHWIAVHGELHTDAEGTRPHMLGIVWDITGRKLSESSRNSSEIRFRRLFETAMDGMMILDAEDYRIRHVNPSLLHLLGYPVEHFLGKDIWAVELLEDDRVSRHAIQQLRAQGSMRWDNLPLRNHNGDMHQVEMIANLYEEDDRQVIQCNIRDITQRSRLEAQLREQAEELSDLHRRKDEFLAMLSHELRSPLAPIANAVRLLGLEERNESPVQKQARGVIERQVGQLQHLVDDLLEVSRITTGRLQLHCEAVTAGDLAHAALETVRPLSNERSQELTLSLPPEPIWLHADVARLEQVLTNLLSNAVKFTDDGGHVWLTVANEGDRCVFRVRDTGVGISPEVLPHVFELFTQEDRSLDRSLSGLGIGLALVMRLTELHGGIVEASSVVGQGSEFVVRLPVAAADSPPPEVVATDDATTTHPLRVLVVDDSVDTAQSFSMLLEASGHEVRTAFDGPTAVQVACEYRPDVVILDVGLPGLNGFEVASRLRLEPALANAVLIALSGYAQEENRQRARIAGFDHYLVKPADFRQLDSILAKASARSD